ncbi:hypothetical protein OIV83_000273 [Microbotryomycetes sp. JL201]|nr:hypothetical protein OIV83_000273 [Microbotryomycetes sp. JL201]
MSHWTNASLRQAGCSFFAWEDGVAEARQNNGLTGNERADAAWQQPAVNEQRVKGSHASQDSGHGLKTAVDALLDTSSSEDDSSSDDNETGSDDTETSSEEEPECKRIKAERSTQIKRRAGPSSALPTPQASSQTGPSSALPALKSSHSKIRVAGTLENELNEASSLLARLQEERTTVLRKRTDATLVLEKIDQQLHEVDTLLKQVGEEVKRLQKEVDGREGLTVKNELR